MKKYFTYIGTLKVCMFKIKNRPANNQEPVPLVHSVVMSALTLLQTLFVIRGVVNGKCYYECLSSSANHRGLRVAER